MVRMIAWGKRRELIRDVAFPQSEIQIDDDEGWELEKGNGGGGGGGGGQGG